METVGLVLILVGIAVAALGWWSTIRDMFAEGSGLGYMGFLVPVAAMVYALIHMEDLKREFWMMLAGAIFILTGILLK